jgi:hypothetical protein
VPSIFLAQIPQKPAKIKNLIKKKLHYLFQALVFPVVVIMGAVASEGD